MLWVITYFSNYCIYIECFVKKNHDLQNRIHTYRTWKDYTQKRTKERKISINTVERA